MFISFRSYFFFLRLFWLCHLLLNYPTSFRVLSQLSLVVLSILFMFFIIWSSQWIFRHPLCLLFNGSISLYFLIILIHIFFFVGICTIAFYLPLWKSLLSLILYLFFHKFFIFLIEISRYFSYRWKPAPSMCAGSCNLWKYHLCWCLIRVLFLDFWPTFSQYWYLKNSNLN